MQHNKYRSGFSLVELTVVVVILGVLATLAVPRFRTSVERTKATEGLSYLHQMERQQSRFFSTMGRYSHSKQELEDVMGETIHTPKFFSTSAISSSNWEKRWSTKLTRNSESSGFGRYTITWGQDGFEASKSSISSELKPDGGGTARLTSGGSSGGGSSSSSSSGSSSSRIRGSKGLRPAG